MINVLTAGSLCTRVVAVTYPDASLASAARLMREQHVGALVVVDRQDQGDTVAGILTDRDIVVSAVALDRDAREVPVGEAMSREVVTAREDEPMIGVLATMRARGLRRLPVVGPHGVLVGLLSFDDLLAAVAIQMQGLAEALIAERQHEAAVRP
jgi:CBS domain-containing protein